MSASQRYPIEMPVDRPFAFDMRYLLDAPAGRHGFLTTRPDGHFYFQDGVQARFWGTNLAGQFGAFLTHAQAERIADALASVGCNMIRFHAFDPERDLAVIDYAHHNDSRHINAERLDEIDYMIYQLKLRGIYTYMDMLDYRKWKPGDDLPETELLNWAGKPACMFNARMIALQKEYATQLLTHVNPYTGLRWPDDPAVAVVETTNENTFFWQQWRDLPPYYVAELNKAWNQWLVEQYGDRETLRKAWTNHQGECALLPDEDPAAATVRMPDVLRAWYNLTNADRAYSDPLTSPARCNDATRLFDLWERAYHVTLRDHLRSLGVKVPITACVTNFVPVDLQAVAEELGFISNGMYFDHPDWSACPLGANYRMARLEDAPELRATGIHAAITWPSLGKVANKPVIVREWNLPWPNQYRSEAMLQMAAYACLQDWDGLLYYGIGGALREPAQQLGFFTSFNDPDHWSQFPLAAQLFLRRDVRAAEVVLDVAHSTVDANYAGTAWRDDPSRMAAYVVRTQKRFFDKVYSGDADVVANVGGSATGDYSGAKRAVLKADNPALDLHDHAVDRSAIATRHQPGLRFRTKLIRDLHIRNDFDNPWIRFEGLGYDNHQFLRSMDPGILLSSLPAGAQPIGVFEDMCMGYIDERRLVIPGLCNIDHGYARREPREWMLTGRLLLDAMHHWGLIKVTHKDVDQGRLPSATGELVRDFKQGILTINTPRFQAAIGFIGGQEIALADLKVNMTTPHCVVALTTQDDQPIRSSERLVLATIGHAVNTDETVRDNLIYDLGRPPILYEPPAGLVILRGAWAGRAVSAQASDPLGGPLYPVDTRVEGDQLSLKLEPRGPVAFYEIRLR
jgi:hypothetical protein